MAGLTHSTVEDFISYVKKNGVVNNNRFDVMIQPPKEVSGIAFSRKDGRSQFGVDQKMLSLMALSVSMPGVNLSTTEMRFGLTRKIPYDKSTGELDVVFRCSGDMLEKRIFDEWIKYIFAENHTVEYYENFISDIIVSSVDNNNNTIYSIRYSEAYPALITPLTFDRENNNQIATFQVTFNYRKAADNEDDSYESSPPVTSQTADFGSADPRIVPRPTLPFINTIPGLTPGQSVQVADLYKQISRVRTEIQNGGLSADSGARLIANLTRSVRATIGDGMAGDAINTALEYLNDASFLLKRK